MKMKLVINVRIREHQAYCGMALLEVVKILLPIFDIHSYPTRCAESRLRALKPAKRPG